MTSRSIRLHRLLGPVAAASAVLAFTASTVLPAETECEGRGPDIILKAYPAAQKISEREFKVGGETIALPADGGDNPHGLTCRIWPARPELMLVATPLMTSQSDNGNEGDIELLVADSDSLKPRARLLLPNLLTDDAIFVSNVAFDTARYRLSRDDTAFGLRIERRGSSRPNPFGETTLWLFVIDDSGLRPVLDNLVVAESQGEWDTNCAGEFHATERTLAMGRPMPGGYSDILVAEKMTKTISSLAPDGTCVDTKRTVASKRHLRFQGAGYGIPTDLKRSD
ncbi:hypothetical protein [Agrobacterium sp. P15N1-A]|uniref:hypothetical protein n=1 Tax=Agrobacterium sp. P15N1-A TaxID=3342820 RepID=UPI0037CD8ED6